MFAGDGYLGCPCGIEDLRILNSKINAKVMEEVNESQELVMLNNFAHESNEYYLRKCIQERISEIASWRWVLEDLKKRLDEVSDLLKYEHNALEVVVQRIATEIKETSLKGCKPGALAPLSDNVEDAIKEELNYLRENKKRFESMTVDVANVLAAVQKTTKRINNDLAKKQEAISIDKNCADLGLESTGRALPNRRKKKKCPLSKWESKCESLKKAGLKALTNAIVTRQQVRGARVQLSITAQAFAARVDAALRKRLHANIVKLDELKWQRDEALKDLKCLEDEQTNTEKNILETMEQERLIEIRLADRSLRPTGELTRDEVDKKLREELGRLRHFTKHLRNNIDRITSLKTNLKDAISKMDCAAEDLLQIIDLDQERLRARIGDEGYSMRGAPVPPLPPMSSNQRFNEPYLSAIQEENEDNDYPFDY